MKTLSQFERENRPMINRRLLELKVPSVCRTRFAHNPAIRKEWIVKDAFPCFLAIEAGVVL